MKISIQEKIQINQSLKGREAWYTDYLNKLRSIKSNQKFFLSPARLNLNLNSKKPNINWLTDWLTSPPWNNTMKHHQQHHQQQQNDSDVQNDWPDLQNDWN